MKQEEVCEKIAKAFSKLLAQDEYLLDVNIHERSLTHKLAEYLQEEFPEWNVDCEYNRDVGNNNRQKMLSSWIKNYGNQEVSIKDTEAHTVYPDIIIHKRGTTNNLAVIEAKKSNYRGVNNDKTKLNAYKTDLGYDFAYMVRFPVEEGEAEKINAENIGEYIREKGTV